MEWLILAFVGIAVLMYAVIRLALVLDAMRRCPTLSEDLSATIAERNHGHEDGSSKIPAEPLS